MQPLTIKHHSLTGRITYQLMYDSFRRVKRNKGAAGVDKVSIAMFESNLEQNLLSLVRDLKTRGAYQPLPARRSYIDKGDGKRRPLGIPIVRDRVAQEALRRLLNPLFEPRFHNDSHGFREKRSCHTAMVRLHEIAQDRRHVFDADIKGFFDEIPHQAIMKGLRYVISDGNILDMIERLLRAGVMEDGVVHPTKRGTPQGGVLSPLLANIALNFLDWHLDQLGYRFVRYADDFVVLCRTKRQAEEAWHVVEQFVTEQLGLRLSPEKTHLTTFRKGFAFLGFEVKSHSVKMRAKSVEKFKNRVRELTRRSHNLDAERIQKLNSVVRGVGRYFATSFSTCRDQYRVLDRWLRMRLRSMKTKRKQWSDNYRIKNAYLRRWGVIFLSDYLCSTRMTSSQLSLERGKSVRGSRRETLPKEPPGARKMHAGKIQEVNTGK